MADIELLRLDTISLADAVDHLLAKGAVLTGDATLSLAGVDLVYVGLNVLIASVESLRGQSPPPTPSKGVGEGSPGQSKSAGISLGVTEPHPQSASVPPYSDPRGAGEGPGVGSASELPPSLPHLYAGSETRLVEQAPFVPPDERPERGLARLVLTLVELLRQVLERQALRRVEGNGLTDEQVERMGIALMELEAKMIELRTAFDLTEEDLVLDLGPLGRLQ